ncbi:MFS transporter [uncultured Bartonella sp.]|uniref:MFS transporter n=1 Tax=uncultured Bartonella sp. TaxID=104108 RepID=UPI00261B69AE|nr:MFS transporter [uncultured Bartonella sp.]
MEHSQSTTKNQSVSKKVITAAVMGGVLEWYDFGAYALFAYVISYQFFPVENQVVSMLLTFITFAVGFLTRPLGAIILGAYSDRVGRKSALSLTMILMAVGMGIIAFCPTYEQIGILAPIIVVIARLIQGVSAGGEIGSALSILVETAPAHKRGQIAAWQQVSQTGAFLVAGVVGWVITAFFSSEQVASWGWRAAFAFGMFVAPVGFYIRRQIDESPAFLAEQKQGNKEHVPFSVLFANSWKPLFLGIGIVLIWTVTSKTASSFMATYAINNLHMKLTSPYLGMIVVGIVLLFCPVVGAWSDRIGRRPIMIGAAIAIFVFAYPSFWLLSAYPNVWVLIAQQFFYAVLMVLYTAPASAALSELFPTAFRSSGIALSYNIAVTIFGGFSPTISTALIGITGDNRAIAYYIMFAALVSIIALFYSPKILKMR